MNIWERKVERKDKNRQSKGEGGEDGDKAPKRERENMETGDPNKCEREWM